MSEKNEWKLVPVVPTDEMVKAAFDQFEISAPGFATGNDARRAIYAAMLNAAPSAPGDAQDERQAFEAWAKKKKMPLARIGQQYDDFWVDHAWNGWQARAALAAPAAGDALAWQGLTDAERDGYVGELVDYGTDFVAPLYSVVESIEKRLREKNGTQQGDA